MLISIVAVGNMTIYFYIERVVLLLVSQVLSGDHVSWFGFFFWMNEPDLQVGRIQETDRNRGQKDYGLMKAYVLGSYLTKYALCNVLNFKNMPRVTDLIGTKTFDMLS